jgi:hypothetical protein
VVDSLLEPGERTFLAALDELRVPYLIVGVTAAVMQGAPLVTQDIDIWFEDRTDARLQEAATRAGGVYVPGHFGMMPTQVGGGVPLDRVIAFKRAAGRPKDLAVLPALEAALAVQRAELEAAPGTLEHDP